MLSIDASANVDSVEGLAGFNREAVPNVGFHGGNDEVGGGSLEVLHGLLRKG